MNLNVNFFHSVFFSRPVVAMLFGLVAWFCSLVPYRSFFQQEVYETLTRYNAHDIKQYFICTYCNLWSDILYYDFLWLQKAVEDEREITGKNQACLVVLVNWPSQKNLGFHFFNKWFN